MPRRPRSETSTTAADAEQRHRSDDRVDERLDEESVAEDTSADDLDDSVGP